MKWIGRGLAAMLLALVAAVATFLVYRHLALPVTEGRLSVAGLREGLRIERDAHGIPTIHAASAQDAWFGLGFVHAQDRLWQLETHKRIAAGRLAEAYGPSAVDADRFLRALSVRRTAERQWAAASPAVRQMLEAYAAGINAFLGDHLRALPPEFVMLGLDPEPWSPVDTIAWSTMMSWDLGANWSTELLRMRLSLSMPVDRIQQLLPPYPGDRPLATADYAALYRHLGFTRPAVEAPPPPAPKTAALDALPWRIEGAVEGTGSNNWVVAGIRTVTGKPMLANDPHLKLTAPGLWYVARMEAPGLKVAGATMPGLPLVILGQNEHIAWGFTNTAPDVQDLYLERLDRRETDRYETPEGWARLERTEEVIRVRGGADVHFTARRSRHGPILSDAGGPTEGLTRSSDPDGARYVIALRWTALDLDATATLEAGLGFNRARSVDEFLSAADDYVAPMQNMVVADGEHVAMVAAGRVPLRRPDHDLKGLVPAPGWDSRYDWVGSVPPDETPRERDPSRGWIATANQRVHGPQYPHFITSEWTAPYRQQRIERLLGSRPLHTLDSLAAIQADVLSAAALRLMPMLRTARSTHPLAAEAQSALAPFDGNMSAERAAPLIFWAWVRQLTRAVFEDDLGEALYDRQLASRSFRDALEGVLDRDDTGWCDDQRTSARETCARQVDAAFSRALDELSQRFGPDIEAWRWGDAHVARAEHRPFSRMKGLARWFEIRTPSAGDTYTVNASRVSLRADVTTGELYLDEHGPGMRALYDLGDPRKSRIIHSTGQSGLTFSLQYRHFVPRWAHGGYVPLWGDGRRGQVLELVPR
jgi:penicillin amidase